MNDTDILNMLKSDPGKGIKLLLDAYTALTYSVISGKVRSVCTKEDIEECVSDVFLDVYRQRNIIDLAKGSFKTYLCFIAKRKAINMYKSHVLKGASVPYDEHIDDESSGFFCGEDELITEEEKTALVKAIANLGEPDCEIIKRKYYFNESTKSIANRLGLSINAVDLRVFRALKKLKEIMQKDYYNEEVTLQ